MRVRAQGRTLPPCRTVTANYLCRGECLGGAGTCRTRLRPGGGAEITRQKPITLDTGLPGVRRVRRRLPVEYPSEDEPQEPQPFDQAAVNTALAGILRF